MKLFLKDMSAVIREIIELNEDQSVGYFLAIYEQYDVEQRSKNDSFNLLKLRPTLIKDEHVQMLGIQKSLESCQLCRIDRISPAERKSKHIVIIIHGFRQQDEDKKEFGNNLIDFYKYAEVYAVSWTSTNVETWLHSGTFKRQNKES